MIDRADGYELVPGSPEGERMAELAVEHAAAAAQVAAHNDEEGRFAAETLAEMQQSGFLSACLPVERGGLGVSSSTDIAAAFCRLARGDGAVALCAHMHIITVLGLGRLWSGVAAVGGELPSWLDDIIDGVARGAVLLCVAGTERSQTLGWFQTVGRPVAGGYSVTGEKVFATNSAGATHLYLMFRIPSTTGGWTNVVTMIDRHSDGIEVLDDWDGMGMRATGSNTVRFQKVFVPGDRIITVSNSGEVSPYWIRFFLEGNVGLLASFVGLAASAREIVRDLVAQRTSAISGESVVHQAGVQHRAADLDLAVFTARSSVERIARLADDFYRRVDAGDARPLPEHHRLMAEFQCAKLLSNRAAIDAVDAAMTLAGGGSYSGSSPLSRLYRDVRAGPFMQALSPIEAYGYIGQVALGVEPELPGRR